LADEEVQGRVVEETIESALEVEADCVVERLELPPEPGIVISVVWAVERVVATPAEFPGPV
jgi:hypothetical protein